MASGSYYMCLNELGTRNGLANAGISEKTNLYVQGNLQKLNLSEFRECFQLTSSSDWNTLEIIEIIL